jgi:hypothetical protein
LGARSNSTPINSEKRSTRYYRLSSELCARVFGYRAVSSTRSVSVLAGVSLKASFFRLVQVSGQGFDFCPRALLLLISLRRIWLFPPPRSALGADFPLAGQGARLISLCCLVRVRSHLVPIFVFVSFTGDSANSVSSPLEDSSTRLSFNLTTGA